MRSGWFVAARAQLTKGEPISEGSLARPDQWVAKVFNYAYGLKDLTSDPPPAPTVVPEKKPVNFRLAAIAAVAVTGVGVVCAVVFGGHGGPPSPPSASPSRPVAEVAPAAVQPQTTPPETVPAEQTEQSKPLPKEPKPLVVVKHEPTSKHRREPTREPHRRLRSAPREAPVRSEPKVSVVHETPPPE
jgi:type IV secretory pathway VirB10-like protein